MVGVKKNSFAGEVGGEEAEVGDNSDEAEPEEEVESRE